MYTYIVYNAFIIHLYHIIFRRVTKYKFCDFLTGKHARPQHFNDPRYKGT